MSTTPFDDLSGGETLRGFTPGQRVLGRYELIRILGRGGMGVVWLAKDQELNREVALKFLPEMLSYNRGAIEDLKRETRRALELSHPNIVRIHDFRQDGSVAAISMEYVDGDTLSNVKADRSKGFLEVGEIRGWIRQLCAALSYAHEEGEVVHRDLKPANLMVTGKGVLKVADFGVSHSLSASVTQWSRVGTVSGTPSYMSPQQMLGEKPSVLDDVYSLGATVYELLTGKPPFYAGNVSLQVERTVPPSMGTRRKDLGLEGEEIPKEWEEVVAACLEKEAGKRPVSVREVAWGLGLEVPPSSVGESSKAGAGKPVSVPDRTDRAQGAGRTFPVGKVLVALVAVGLLLGGGWYFGVYKPRRGAAMDSSTSAASVLHEVPKAGRAAKLESELVILGPLPGPHEATRSAPFFNSLSMQFVPVGVARGGVALFSVWETRVKDYAAYANSVRGVDESWKDPVYGGRKVTPSEDCPVVNVSWEDVKVFAKWLTEKERKEGWIPASAEYRLPTDEEWSWAVGIGNKESPGIPEAKSLNLQGEYSWGTTWPPPPGAGNFTDATYQEAFGETAIVGYRDGYATTSPVGSFGANKNGLYDLAGNVSEWCEDYYDPLTGLIAVRGGSWGSYLRERLPSSNRRGAPPAVPDVCVGFRLVLVGGSAH